MSRKRNVAALAPAPPDSDGKWLERSLLLAAILASAVAISPSVADADLWGHVQYGLDALADGLPATTTYSYTAVGYCWINHENLAELLFAMGAGTIGPLGLLAVKCLLGVGVISLIIYYARRQGAGLLTASAVSLLVSVNLAYHWSVRPQLLTYVYLTLLILLLSWCFEGWEGRLCWPRFGGAAGGAAPAGLGCSPRRMHALWLTPLLMCFWANSHGGFVAGYCMFAAYLTFRSLEALSCRGREALGLVGRFALILAASGLATFINPYGPRLHLWLYSSLGSPPPEITEWNPPNFLDPLSIPLWLMMAMLLLLVTMSQRRRDFTHLAVMGLALCQVLLHQRHVPFVAIPFGFWMPLHVESVMGRLWPPREQSSSAARMGLPARGFVIAGFCAAYILLGVKLYDRLRDMPVQRETYPVSALQYIADQDLNGKMVVTYNWAQYVIAAFGDKDSEGRGIQVGFDGRFDTCYPREIIDMHFDFVLGDGPSVRRLRSPSSPPYDNSRVLEYGQPDLVLLCRGQTNSERVMNQHRDQWVLLYQDNLAQLWGRASKYDSAGGPDYVPPDERVCSEAAQTGSATWPALPVRGRGQTRLASMIGS